MRHRSATWVECGKRVRAVLLEEWDPIGAGVRDEASDEYDGYALRIIGLLVRKAPAQALADFLWHTETATLGLPGDRERVTRVAGRLATIPAEVEREQDA